MSVRKSLAWSYAAQVASSAIGLAAAIVLARLLTPHELGVYAIAIAVVGILSIFSSIGIGPYLIRETLLKDTTKAGAFTINAVLNLAVAAVIWGLGSVSSGHLDGNVTAVLRVLALGPVFAILEFLPSALLMREMRFDTIAQINIGRSLVNSISTIFFAAIGFTYLSPALGSVLAATFSAICFTIVGRRHVSFRLSLNGWREITTFAIQMMSVGGVAVFAARMSEIVIAKMLGLAPLGFYNRASVLSTALWENAYGIATRVIFAQMAEEQRQYGVMRKTFLQATQILTAVMWPATAGTAILAGPLVHLLYGEKWLGAATPLALLMIAQLVAMAFAMNWELCVLTHRTGWQARAEIVRGVVGLAAFSLGSLFGLAAATAGRVVEAMVGLLIYQSKMTEMAGTAPGELGKAYQQSIIATAAALTPILCLMIFWRWSPFTPVPLILISVLTGGFMWLYVLKKMQHPIITELRNAYTRVLSVRTQ